jgi:hypothetical protein
LSLAGRLGFPHETPRRRKKIMAEGKSRMRIALSIVGAMLGLLVFEASGCSDIFAGSCSCPPPPTSAAIELGCVPAEPPVVKTTGPCSVCPAVPPNTLIPGCAVPENSPYIIVAANGAGTCHVDLTFANGAASSVDVEFVSEQMAACCGNGEGFIPVTADGSYDNLTVQDPTCDAGQDAAPSD